MPDRDPRIDAYIANAADFARPILERARAIVHEACPQVQETIKWGMPSFIHAGRILCGMAAFRRHAVFGFWEHARVVGEGGRTGMGSFGKMTSVRDLPPKRELVALVRKAMALNEQPAPPRKRAAPRPPAAVPADLARALQAHPAARAAFDAFPPGHRREYIAWIEDARREDTRARRLAQAIEWLAEGKPRNWKYQRR
ncbi:MAG: YdeI/OmpD-associated family protein [Lysobacteraceae bacterium]